MKQVLNIPQQNANLPTMALWIDSDGIGRLITKPFVFWWVIDTKIFIECGLESKDLWRN